MMRRMLSGETNTCNSHLGRVEPHSHVTIIAATQPSGLLACIPHMMGSSLPYKALLMFS